MSESCVDDLHAAEDEVGRLRYVLNRIHAVMAWPLEWSSDTAQGVGEILLAEGYKWIDEADPLHELDDRPPLDAFKPWRPAIECLRGCDEDCDDCCGCPAGCHDEEE